MIPLFSLKRTDVGRILIGGSRGNTDNFVVIDYDLFQCDLIPRKISFIQNTQKSCAIMSSKNGISFIESRQFKMRKVIMKNC